MGCKASAKERSTKKFSMRKEVNVARDFLSCECDQHPKLMKESNPKK